MLGASPGAAGLRGEASAPRNRGAELHQEAPHSCAGEVLAHLCPATPQEVWYESHTSRAALWLVLQREQCTTGSPFILTRPGGKQHPVHGRWHGARSQEHHLAALLLARAAIWHMLAVHKVLSYMPANPGDACAQQCPHHPHIQSAQTQSNPGFTAPMSVTALPRRAEQSSQLSCEHLQASGENMPC